MNEQEILNEIKKLDNQHKLDIVQQVLQMLKISNNSFLQTTKTHKITELQGLGKNLWTEIDANIYVNEERQTWS